MCPSSNQSITSFSESINTYGGGGSKKLREFRLRHKLLGTTRLTQNMGKVVSVMLETPKLRKTAIKILKCNSHKRCNYYDCRFCGVAFKEQHKQINANGDVIPYEFPIIEPGSKIYSSGNSRVDLGNRFHQFELRHKDKNIFAATINIDFFPFNENTDCGIYGNCIKDSSIKFRNLMNTIFGKLGKQFAYLGQFEDSISIISDDLKHHVQNTSWRRDASNCKYAIKLHVHMIVAGITKEEFEKALSRAGMGEANQVRCSDISEVRIDGWIVKGGSRGWGQYSGKMFMNYDCCNYQAWVIRFTKLYREVFKKRNRKCSFNAGIKSQQYKTTTNAVTSCSNQSDIVYEELIDAPFQYEFIPLYGVGSYISTSISWNTILPHDSKSIILTPIKWVSWFTLYVSTILDASLFLLSSLYNSNNYSNSVVQHPNKTRRLMTNNDFFAEQTIIYQKPLRRVISYPRRE